MKKSGNSMKGMSLALETVVLLILMAVVLAALLAFFLGVFTPSKSQLDLIKNKESYCVQYVSRDPGCAHANEISSGTDPFNDVKYTQAKSAIAYIKSNLCNKPTENPICSANCEDPVAVLKACCSTYC